MTEFSSVGLEVESVAANPRQIQQFIDQQPHAVNAIFDALQMARASGCHGGAKVLDQDSGKTANVPRAAPADHETRSR